jgi:RNA polymerase sigma-70 factor (ECF subfamily)
MHVREIAAATVRAAQAGDAAAYGALVEACWDGLVRFARSVAGEAEAEDAVQEALVAAWHALPGLQDPTKFRSWVTQIVFRRCLRAQRWWRLRAALPRVAPAALAPDPGATVDLWRLLARLPPRQRAVLHLTVVEEMTDAEIAERLSMAASSVRAHRRRARARLRAIVGGDPS